MRRWSGLVALVVMCLTAEVRAQDAQESSFVWLPGAARDISRTVSASRDTPVFEYAYGPRAQTSLGGEWAWFGVLGPKTEWRLGMYGMMALENAHSKVPFPPGELWRGMIGANVALSLPELGERWLGREGAFEITLTFGHESDHGGLDDPPRPGDIPKGGGGQSLTPDVALRVVVWNRLVIELRVQCRTYLRGALVAAPGGDIVLEWRNGPHMVPLLAVFGEALIPRGNEADPGFFFRLMAGVAVPGRIGQATFFWSVDVGNGKGLLINRKELRMGIGLRYAPFSW